MVRFQSNTAWHYASRQQWRLQGEHPPWQLHLWRAWFGRCNTSIAGMRAASPSVQNMCSV